MGSLELGSGGAQAQSHGRQSPRCSRADFARADAARLYTARDCGRGDAARARARTAAPSGDVYRAPRPPVASLSAHGRFRIHLSPTRQPHSRSRRPPSRCVVYQVRVFRCLLLSLPRGAMRACVPAAWLAASPPVCLETDSTCARAGGIRLYVQSSPAPPRLTAPWEFHCFSLLTLKVKSSGFLIRMLASPEIDRPEPRAPRCMYVPTACCELKDAKTTKPAPSNATAARFPRRA